MTQFLRFRLSRPGGPDAAAALEQYGRRVPKISLVPPERAPVVTRLVLALLAALLVEAIVLQRMYGDFQDTKRVAVALGRDLDRVVGLNSTQRSAISDEEQAIAAVDEQIQQLETQRQLIDTAYSELTAGRTAWGTALDALLGEDGLGVRFDKIVGLPGGRVDVTGTAKDVAGFSSFLDHMRTERVADILFLRDSGFEEGDSNLVFTTNIEVK